MNCFHLLQLTTASGDAEHHLSLVTVLQGSLEPSILGEEPAYQYLSHACVCVCVCVCVCTLPIHPYTVTPSNRTSTF